MFISTSEKILGIKDGHFCKHDHYRHNPDSASWFKKWSIKHLKCVALHSFVKIKKFWSFQQVGEELNNLILLFKYAFH